MDTHTATHAHNDNTYTNTQSYRHVHTHVDTHPLTHVHTHTNTLAHTHIFSGFVLREGMEGSTARDTAVSPTLVLMPDACCLLSLQAEGRGRERIRAAQ